MVFYVRFHYTFHARHWIRQYIGSDIIHFCFHATYFQRKNVFSAWTFRQIILSNNDVTRERKNTTVFIYTCVRATINELIV